MTVGITILGSTGSIGINTLDVISRHSDKYHVSALSAQKSVTTLLAQCEKYNPEKVVMTNPDCAEDLRKKCDAAGLHTIVESGDEALTSLADGFGQVVVCGIVGAAGLMSTIAAVKSGKKVLIANKEPLVMLGEYIVNLAHASNACLLPLDSEHNAIFQCLPQQHLIDRNGFADISHDPSVNKILLTGSGGPFRNLAIEKFCSVTPDQACAHPNWQMGRKISVDSATMMNKGLELIEACALFGLPAERIEIVVHPQSVIHSMVEYIDGSILAQMGSPDMRVPIASALAWPERIESGAKFLDFRELSQFEFESPDLDRFPALRLAQTAAENTGTLPAIMNAANEIAVEAFLNQQISFDKITQLVELTMENTDCVESNDLDAVLLADHAARARCKEYLQAGIGAQKH